jgi:hypothetical protein
MKARSAIITLIALVAIAVLSVWAYRHEVRRETAGMCPFCDRPVHSVTAYQLKWSDHVVVACCPRCGMHAQANQPQVDRALASATDANTGESIPAEAATYVEGGDVQYCTHGEQAVAREPQGVSTRAYDRCLPVLVAFKTPQEAAAYQQQHGGRVLSYAQALDSVREQ